MDHETDDRLMARLFSLDDGAGPAPRIGAQHADALVEGALDAFFAAQIATEARPTKRAQRSPMRWMVAAATLLAVTGSASAAILIQHRRERAATLAPADAREARNRREPAPYPPPGAGVEVPPAHAVPTDPVEIEVEAAPPPRDFAPRPAPVVARDLLAEANRLRGQRRFGDADRAYRLVIRTEPRGREAYVARIASASLKLEHLGDPAGAARLYRQALGAGSSGALAAEAQYGLARSYRRLGQAEAESRALALVVSRYPSSAYASAAQRRLAELRSAPNPR
jgi:tetratricopeptide (TPR) repeat protein